MTACQPLRFGQLSINTTAISKKGPGRDVADELNTAAARFRDLKENNPFLVLDDHGIDVRISGEGECVTVSFTNQTNGRKLDGHDFKSYVPKNLNLDGLFSRLFREGMLLLGKNTPTNPD